MTRDEAARLAEENIGLLYGAVRLYPNLWPNGDEEEAVSVAQLAFWRACQQWRPERGKLSTLVYTAVMRQLQGASRPSARRGTGVSFEEWMGQPVTDRRDGLGADGGAAPWWLRLLTEDDRLVLRLRAEGKTYEQIGEVIGVTKERVRQVLGEMRAVLESWGVRPGDIVDKPRWWHDLPERRPSREGRESGERGTYGAGDTGDDGMAIVKTSGEDPNGAGVSPDGFVVRLDSPPPPRGRAPDPLTGKILALKPGEHIRIGRARFKSKQTLQSRVYAAKKDGGHPGLYSYEAVDGTLVVAIDPDRKPRTRATPKAAGKKPAGAKRAAS